MIDFDDLEKNILEIQKKGWIKSTANGQGAVGITFENLLGKEKENFEIPDYNGIEIKTKLNNSQPYIALFNATPDSYLFEIKRLYETHGYFDIENPDKKIFRVQLYGNKLISINNNLKAKIIVDRKKQLVILNIYNKNNELIDNNSSWSFEILNEKLMRKLKYLAIIKAYKKVDNEIKYFKYTDYNFYKLKSFENFIDEIENGNIMINFKVGIYKTGKKQGEIHDHGTGFNIKKENITKIFALIK